MAALLRVLALLGLLLALNTAQAEKLRLVADSWPPFADASMPGGGLATVIVTTALRRAGYDSEFEQVPWARALLGVEEGRYDVLINAWFNDSRTQIGAFSEGYLTNRIRLLKRKGDPLKFKVLSDLYPYPVAVVRGYTYSPAFDADQRLQRIPVRNFSVAVRMLAAGRVGLTLEDEYVARYFLQRESRSVRDHIEFIDPPVSENPLHILVSMKTPEHQQIVAGFNRALVEMKADGSYERLLKHYGF
ncbi:MULTISPECIES: ABC transporter substrate-binding protein [Pseudomonas]|uniref:Transporter substrate-binding domain-containing protein n=1 Tax=Pseudomonas sp. Hg7Tf TaxID=3236988 RepID=A0AB39HVA5_9PSED|nr:MULTISPECIES: transporter substrate-binding domain-containing protein [Pseudomonas]KJK09013.1 amino acid ABC transporter substrate-binding protein [Pseudomonas sp. 5]MDD1975702.1 transporter substrate-binding domain-containing protein [Pseudomonas putida]MDH2560223.1 transporter substrate-binding domain-containing protein [Pseudomonas sp. Hg5Tf]QYX46026.1 transporter substrate-binding domain-containing protein [Pseudomonas sp. S11A 273]